MIDRRRREGERPVTHADPILKTDLFSSCDGVSVYLKDEGEPLGGYHREGHDWLHYDRATADRHNGWSVQGFVNLLPTDRVKSESGSGGGAAFQCLVRSHRYQQEFAARFAVNPKARFLLLQSQAEVDFFLNECDAEHVCVRANVGDLVMWDSRLVHCGRAATRSARLLQRTVVYVSMQPKWLMSKKRDLRRKRVAFDELRTTSHNAAVGVKLFGRYPNPYGRRGMERNRASRPIDAPPKLTALGLSLFGIDGQSYHQARKAYELRMAKEEFRLRFRSPAAASS